MNFLKKSFVQIFIVLITIGCGKNESSSGSGNTQGLAGQAFNKAEQSISSAGAELASKKILQSLSSSMGVEAYDPHCTGMGPNAGSSADYIGCILQNNDGSPETILGALDQVNQIIAGIESRMTLTFPATPLISDEMTFSITTSDGTLTPTIAIREASGNGVPWTEVIDVCIISLTLPGPTQISNTIDDCINNGFNYTIQLLSNNTQLGFRTINRLGSYEVVSFLIDNSSDELRFESWSFANGNHTRGYVTGNVSSSLVLDTVIGVRFASAWVDGGNWGGLYGSYDGSNICMNYESSATVDATQSVGTCSSYPEYDSGFHNFSGSAAFDSWANDSGKGLLNFDDSAFNESAIFINN